jgi:hypothetical protein
MDTLAVQLAVPLIGPAKVFHLLGLRPAGRTKKRGAKRLPFLEILLQLLERVSPVEEHVRPAAAYTGTAGRYGRGADSIADT